ncbi:MAG: hypothetical protein GXZ13_00735 [Synergistaceae bacterium]|nr:hypothetical protein [Synergistaceae bacterium]
MLIRPENRVGEFRPKVLEVIHWAERNNYIPSFSRTVEGAAKRFKADKAKISAALSNLINDGYIKQTNKTLPNGTEIRALEVDWELVAKHRIWDPSQVN